MGAGIAWGMAGIFLLVSVVSVFLLKKSRDESKNSIEQFATLQESNEKMSDDLENMRTELKEKTVELEALQNEFDERMDKVVQSSIQKIEHAEQAKEEAIQAAQDNLEAATEVHALLKEKEKLIARLQEQAVG